MMIDDRVERIRRASSLGPHSWPVVLRGPGRPEGRPSDAQIGRFPGLGDRSYFPGVGLIARPKPARAVRRSPSAAARSPEVKSTTALAKAPKAAVWAAT